MLQSIVITSAASATLKFAPIYSDWILEGEPVSHNTLLAVSRDKTARVMAWECTPGFFNWYYTEDETVYIIYGEVFITENGIERQLTKGDMAFFPAGSTCTWRVTKTVRKVAFLRKDLPPPFGLCVRVWNKLLRKAGIRRDSPL